MGSWEDGIRAGDAVACADAIDGQVSDGDIPFVRVPRPDGGHGLVVLLPDDASQLSKLFSVVARMPPDDAGKSVLVEIDSQRITPSFGIADTGALGPAEREERVTAIMGWLFGTTGIARELTGVMRLADQAVRTLLRVPGAALTDFPFLLIEESVREAMIELGLGESEEDAWVASCLRQASPEHVSALVWCLEAVLDLPMLRHPLCLPHGVTDLCRMAEDGRTVFVLLPPPAFDRGLARSLLSEVATRQLARLSLRPGAEHGAIPGYAAEALAEDKEAFRQNMLEILLASAPYMPRRDEVSKEDRRRRHILMSDDRDAIMGLLSEGE